MRDMSAASLLSRQGFLAVSISATGALLLRSNDAGAEEYFRLQVKQSGKFLDAVNCSDLVALHPGSDYANGGCQLWRFVRTQAADSRPPTGVAPSGQTYVRRWTSIATTTHPQPCDSSS